jgi:hypothetical protein
LIKKPVDTQRSQPNHSIFAWAQDGHNLGTAWAQTKWVMRLPLVAVDLQQQHKFLTTNMNINS